MSVYFKFEDPDILYSVINASPKITMASGSAGWRSNTGVSSSLSLYGGVRGRTDVQAGSPSGLSVYPLDPMDTNTIDKVVFVSGSYPATGSVHFVKCRSNSIDTLTAIDPFLFNEGTLVTSDDWYEEHFNPILGLYEYYSRFNPEYFTGSYDYYSLYLKQNVKYLAPCVYFSGNLTTSLSSSATFMAQVKPTQISGSHDYTIQSQFQKFKFFITGSNGKLAFTDYVVNLTSSAALTLGVWQGVAITLGNGSASFYINGTLDTTIPYVGTLSNQTGSFLQIGAEIVLSGSVLPPTPVIFRSTGPVPNTGPLGPVGVQRVYTAPMLLPGDATNLVVGMANRSYSSNATIAITSSLAVYRSDGFGNPTGSSLNDSVMVLPAGGMFASSTTMATPTSGTDKKIVLLYSFNDPGQFFYSAGTDLGQFTNSTLTVDPPPVPAGSNPNPNHWIDLQYKTTARRIIVLGDSISVGYSVNSSVGFTGSAWNKIMSTNGYAVNIIGSVFVGSYSNFAASGSNPNLWNRITDIMSGSDVVFQLGTNDLSYANATQMLGNFQQVYSGSVKNGARRIYAWTVPPQQGYTGAETERNTWNSYIRLKFASMGLSGFYDAAQPFASGGLASNTVTSSLATSLDSGDGTHPNVAGQNFMASGWTSVLQSNGGDATTTVNTGMPVFDNGFSGFIFDSRVMSTQLSAVQVSSSWNVMQQNSSSFGLIHYTRFNDGPLASAHGFVQGSGAFDFSPTAKHGSFVNIGSTLPVSPIWQPNDNPSFVTKKTRVHGPVGMFRVLHVPSMFYGRQIATGSVNLTCDAYSNQGLRRVVVDDGRGSLYLSGSICKSISGEDYVGVPWRKVGNVFYSEGLVVITDPCLMDFGDTNLDTSTPNDTLQVTFRGLERISTRTFMCRVGAAQANASNNPTFAKLDPNTGKFELTLDDGTTWITAIGLYNETRDLIAVAKLAQPIRKREKDKLNIKLRFDY